MRKLEPKKVTREYTIRVKVTADRGEYQDMEMDITEQVISNLDTISDEVGWGNNSGYQSAGVLKENGLEWEYEWNMDETS